MTEERLNRFFVLFIDSVNNVAASYIRTVYGEMEMVAQMLNHYERRNLVGNDLIKTGERIFCYELYHQLRMRMDAENPNIFNNVFLQGELRKHQLEPLLDRFGLRRLSYNFIPDLLLHSPGNADEHPYVIEIKTTRFLAEPELADDIEKIAEFICNYDYQRGVFLGINLSIETLTTMIINSERIIQIPRIQEIKNRITIAVRENENIQTQHQLLSEII